MDVQRTMLCESKAFIIVGGFSLEVTKLFISCYGTSRQIKAVKEIECLSAF